MGKFLTFIFIAIISIFAWTIYSAANNLVSDIENILKDHKLVCPEAECEPIIEYYPSEDCWCPAYEECEECEECQECIDYTDELEALRAELNQWKTDFDQSTLYDLCRKDKKFCNYL